MQSIDTLGLEVSRSANAPVLLFDTEQSEAQLYKNSEVIHKRAMLEKRSRQFFPYSFSSLSREARLRTIVELMAKALRSEHFAMVGFEGKHYLTDEDRWTLVYNLTDEKRTIIKRDYIVSTLSDAQRCNYTAVMLLGYAEQHAQQRVNEIRATHNAVYEKRHERILEKISTITTR